MSPTLYHRFPPNMSVTTWGNEKYIFWALHRCDFPKFLFEGSKCLCWSSLYFSINSREFMLSTRQLACLNYSLHF